MAKKEPETVDRYAIIAQTSLDKMGFVLAAVTKLVGEENVRCQLITDELRYKDRTVHEVSAVDFTAEFVKDNPRFKSVDLTAHFRAAGREPGGAYYALTKLTKANVIRKNGDEFVRVEALAAPEPKLAKRRPSNTAHYDVPNKGLIANAIKGRKQFTMSDLSEVFAKEGRNPKSISPIVTKMVQAKQLKLTGPGQYLVLAKGAKPTANKKLTPAQRRKKDKLRKQAERATAKEHPDDEAPELALNGAMMNGSGEAAHG